MVCTRYVVLILIVVYSNVAKRRKQLTFDHHVLILGFCEGHHAYVFTRRHHHDTCAGAHRLAGWQLSPVVCIPFLSWSAPPLLALFVAASLHTAAVSSSHRLKFRVEKKFSVDPTPLSQTTQILFLFTYPDCELK